jgi:hypothetical protein
MQSDNKQILFIMTDQPFSCWKCGSRAELLEIKMMDCEEVFVTQCLWCNREILFVEN